MNLAGIDTILRIRSRGERMIFAENTRNSVGVAISGDHGDFNALYEGLHNVVGDESEFPGYETPRLRVLGICYDLRHAMMGDRDFVFVDNGRDEYGFWPEDAPDANLYLKIHVLWPEMLFVQLALNDFVQLYATQLARKFDKRSTMVHTNAVWDESLAITRLFQAAVARCLQDTVTPSSYRRIIRLMTRETVAIKDYTTQYVDILNESFLDMKPEVRRQRLSRIGKWLAERGGDYGQVKGAVKAAALHYGVREDDIAAPVHYPEVIEW